MGSGSNGEVNRLKDSLKDSKVDAVRLDRPNHELQKHIFVVIFYTFERKICIFTCIYFCISCQEMTKYLQEIFY